MDPAVGDLSLRSGHQSLNFWPGYVSNSPGRHRTLFIGQEIRHSHAHLPVIPAPRRSSTPLQKENQVLKEDRSSGSAGRVGPPKQPLPPRHRDWGLPFASSAQSLSPQGFPAFSTGSRGVSPLLTAVSISLVLEHRTACHSGAQQCIC